MTKRPSDIDLMLYADGELSAEEAREVAERVEGEERAGEVVAGVREVGEAVRTHMEREVDAAIERSPRFDRLWAEIDRRIHANGAAGEAAAGAKEAVAETSSGADEAQGLLERLLRWLREHRGHMVSGAVAAGVTAAVLLVALPRERVIEREVRVEVPAEPVPAAPVSLESRAPEVENLEFYDGSGMVLTIPGEGEDGGGTAVIWLTPDEDTTEGPI